MLDLEVVPHELKTILAGQDQPFLLDVREPWETNAVGFPGAHAMPMGEVPARAHQELDPDGRIVVICHHGVRSLNVANWLRNQGFEQAQSLRGGIDAWSRDVDPGLLRY
ncbi:MAG TPA: rhodanese-like domain-containing protein [Acidobacteriaceae bacterium]|jgi:rhodanese-related sulfurtransferase